MSSQVCLTTFYPFFFFDIAHFKGSVLSVWTLVESVLTNDGQKKGQHAKMQVGFKLNNLALLS